jgi:hypothetical protein
VGDVVSLRDNGQVCALGQQRRQQLVDVSSDASPVRRHGRGVDDDAQCIGQDGS